MRQLGRLDGVDTALAWMPGPGGPYVAAADYAGEPPREPAAHELETLALLEGATDLGDGDPDSPRQGVRERHRCAAAAPVRGPAGELLAVLLVGCQGTPRPRLLAALDASARALVERLAPASPPDADARQQGRLADLGRLCAEIAHEVRNPLVSIKTFVELLPRRLHDPDFLEHFGSVVGEELRRMERLLDRVIEHGRPAPAQAPARAPVAEALEAVGALLRHRAASGGVALETRAAAGLPEADVSPDELRQVLLNLTLNALDATPDGGSVRVEACSAPGGLRIDVADDGPGVPPEVLRQLVDGPGGEPGGLGLRITRQIVEAAGGSLEAANRPGGGSEFRLFLPGSR